MSVISGATLSIVYRLIPNKHIWKKSFFTADGNFAVYPNNIDS